MRNSWVLLVICLMALSCGAAHATNVGEGDALVLCAMLVLSALWEPILWVLLAVAAGGAVVALLLVLLVRGLVALARPADQPWTDAAGQAK